MGNGWIKTPAEKYGGAHLSNQPGQSDEARELAPVAAPAGVLGAGSPFSPHSPLFWLAAVGLASVGLAAYSTSVRVGPASASVSLGK